MIKVFTTNKNGKIELTKDELKQLLDDAYWEGYRTNSTTYIYQPYWSPYQSTTDKDINYSTVTITSNTNE